MNTQQAFLNLCRKIGLKTPLWVQGAGGNVSQKFEHAGQQILRIKASGYRLDHVTEKQGFVDLSYKEIATKIANLHHVADGEKQYADLLATGVVGRSKAFDRASMETGFHLFIEAPLVAHFHSLAALLFADLYFKSDPKAVNFVKNIPKAHEISVHFIDYVKPGLDLSLEVKAGPVADIYFLKNHGVILGLQNENEFENWIRLEKSMIDAFEWPLLLQEAEERSKGYWPLAGLMPDTIVFMDKLFKVLEENPKQKGSYRLNQDNIDPNLYELWLANVLLLSTKSDISPIPITEWESISGMPVEKYRHSLQNA